MATFSANSKSYEGRYLNLTINQVQNIEKNTSTLNWTLTSTGGSSTYYTIYPTTIRINGEEVYSKDKTDWDDYVFPAKKDSVSDSIEVEHNSDGSKTVEVYFYTGVYFSAYQANYGGNFTLDNIPRANSISVSNYDLGQDIGITIGKKADSFTSTLTYKIGSRTGTIATKTSSSTYVWEMSDELISQIKRDNPSNAKPSATIYCETYSGNTKIGETKSATFTLTITDKPTLTSLSADEVRWDIKSLTTSILKYISIMIVTAEGIAPEGTTISNYKLRWGNIERNNSTGKFEIDNIQYSYLDSNGNRKTKLTVVVTDARGNSSDGFFSSEEYPMERDFIEYVIPAFNNTDVKFKRLNGTSNFVKLHMTGYFYNGLLTGLNGETKNYLTIQYRYKLKNDASAQWSELKTIDATLNADNTFIIDDYQFEEEFDYRENYDIEFYADDLFCTEIYSSVIKTSETIAKWHKGGAYIKEIDTNQLKVNDKDIIGSVLFEGDSNEDITLNDNVSNYEYIDIFYRSNDGYCESKKVYSPNGKNVNLTSFTPTSSTNTGLYIKTKTITISNNTIKNNGTRYQEIFIPGAGEHRITASIFIYITKVIGHKI